MLKGRVLLHADAAIVFILRAAMGEVAVASLASRSFCVVSVAETNAFRSLS